MKIGFLITVRLKSTRLPMKALKDIKGKTMVERVIDRAKSIKGINKVVMCTSCLQPDALLFYFADKTKIEFFCGDPDDVLVRLRDAANKYGFDYVLGITADNPLFSVEYAEKIIKIFKKNSDIDYIMVNGLPYGAAPWGMSVDMLNEICRTKTETDTEVWGRFIDKRKYCVYTIEAEDVFCRPNYRLTVDYPEDYDFINFLYHHIPFKNILPLNDVINYIDMMEVWE